MNYIYASEFNHKLYQVALSLGYDVIYINTGKIVPLNDSDALITDEKNPMNIHMNQVGRVAILTEDDHKTDQGIYVYKFQSVPKILSNIFYRDNRLTICLGDSDAFEPQAEPTNLTRIDFKFTSNNNTTLTELTELLEKGVLLDMVYKPMGTFMDVLKPPIKSIEKLIELSKSKNDTLIFLESIKGPADAVLLAHANELKIDVNSIYGQNSNLISVLNQIYPNLVITEFKTSEGRKMKGVDTWNQFVMKFWNHLRRRFWKQQIVMRKN
jgi:hypothetical protein